MRARLKEWRRLSSKGAHVILGVAPGPAAAVAAPEIAARHSGPLQPLAPVPVPEEGHRLRLRFGAAAGERLQGRGAEMRVQRVQSVQRVQRVQRVPRASGEGERRGRGEGACCSGGPRCTAECVSCSGAMACSLSRLSGCELPCSGQGQE